MDEVHRYNTPPVIPRVHWREPVVEEMYRYPPLIHSKKPKSDKSSNPHLPSRGLSHFMVMLTVGVLKDGDIPKFGKAPKHEIVNTLDQSSDAVRLANYPPLIPLVSEDSSTSKSHRKGNVQY